MITSTPADRGLQEDYQAINESPSDYVQSLVVRTFCPLPSTTQSKIDVPTEVANYNSYLQFYKDSKDAFIKVVKPLVEKLLGVKMFFDQYKCKTKGMIPTLLVANLKPEMLAKSSSLPTLHAYLNTVNSKNNFKDTIWYAIFPNLSISLQAGAKLRRERFAGNVHKVNEDVNSLETLSTLLDVLKDYRWRPSSPSRPGRRPLSMRWRPRESRSSSTAVSPLSESPTVSSPSRACRTLPLSQRTSPASHWTSS